MKRLIKELEGLELVSAVREEVMGLGSVSIGWEEETPAEYCIYRNGSEIVRSAESSIAAHGLQDRYTLKLRLLLSNKYHRGITDFDLLQSSVEDRLKAALYTVRRQTLGEDR